MRIQRTTLAEKFRAAKECCQAALSNVKGHGLINLLNSNWKVLVIKRDAEAGRYVTSTLCCEEATSQATALT